MDTPSRDEEEIQYWKGLFESALAELKQTHVNVYRFTLGRPPSPHERDRTRATLQERPSRG